MRYAILSDVHGRAQKLKKVIADAQTRQARQFISLGDVGGEDCLALIREVGAQAVFGNYEVSGWRRLKPEFRDWLRGWPPLLAGQDFLAVHAAPFWPEGLCSIADFGRWLKRTGRSWRALFPYLSEDDGCMWQALAELETTKKPILFHGHTHRHAIWQLDPGGRLRQVRTDILPIKAGHLYVVGVGSVGLPEDGCWAAYTLYDDEAACIELIRLTAPPSP